MVKKLSDWEVKSPDRDTVRIYDSVGFGADADLLRSVGVPTWASCRYADRLENDRRYAEGIASSIGFKVPDSYSFDNIADAKAFVKSHNDKLVLKPDGESAGMIPSTCPKGDGKDAQDELLEVLSHIEGKFIGKPKLLLQEFIPDAVEISTEAWFCGRLVKNLNHTFESKKMMDDESGPTDGCAGNIIFPADNPVADKIFDYFSKLKNIDQAFGPLDVNCLVTGKEIYWLEWCYSEDTEVLTHSGWKPMKDVHPGDIVAGLNDDKELVYVPVEETTKLRWNRPILHVHSKNTYDLMVTPNHNMVLQDKIGRLYHKAANKIRDHGERTVRTARWRGLDLPSYCIPGYTELHKPGKSKRVMPIPHRAVELPMEDWCRFLGLFIAYGNLHIKNGSPYQTQVRQFSHVEECKAIFEKLPFKWSYHHGRFVISSIQLGTHLLALMGPAKAPAKRVPRFILDLAPQYIEAFLDGFRVGDGNIHKRSGLRTFHTSSPGLADDIGECVLRIGRWSRIRKSKLQPGISGKFTQMYAVCERKIKTDGSIWRKRHIREISYEGTVVCLTVPYHRLYVRRPGGPAMWCANTPRFGYDASPTLFSRGVHGELGKIFSDLAKGQMKRAPLVDGFSSGLRLFLPPCPHEVEDFEPWTLRGVTLKEMYPYSINRVNGKLMITNTRIGSALGYGSTIKSAMGESLKVAEKVQMNQIMFRHDLTEKFQSRYDKFIEIAKYH